MMASSSSSSSATVAVEKATSDLLMGPDWTMNIEICDSINSNHWQPKDVVRAVKRRLQHRSSRVQLLALTLLETMVKNCGDFVHFQIAERNILEEMIKIVRKKSDMQVRDKILILLDSWQEAFGGPGGKHPQYYWAYEELKRSGVVFPKRSPDAAPIFTPPPTHPNLRNMQAGYGMPTNSSKTLDETMATEIESLSMSSLDSMQDVLDLLSDMLQAVNPSDRAAVKDEVIIDLVDRCRINQKKLMQMLTTTGDEELLGRGLELNDSIQSLLARHDAIASGTPFPIQGASSSTVSTEVQSSVDQSNRKSSSPRESSSAPKSSSLAPKASSSAIVFSETRRQSDEEEEDEFAQLARRHSKAQAVTSTDSSENSVSVNTSSSTPHVPNPSSSVPSNALVLSNPPAPVCTAKDQDIIDLLSITLSMSPSPQTTYEPSSQTTYEPSSQTTYAPSPQTTYAPSASSQGMHQLPVQSRTEGYSYASQTYPGNLSYNSYIVPWAQHQSISDVQTQSQQQTDQSQSQSLTPPSSGQLRTHYESKQQHHQPTQQGLSQPQSEQLQSQPLTQSPRAFQQQLQHHQYSPQQHSQPHSEPQALEYQPQHQTLQSQPQLNPHSHPQPQLNPHSHPRPQPHSQSHPQPQLQYQPQTVLGLQPQPQQQFQNQHVQYPARYPPPPWAATPGYANYQNHSPATNVISTQANTTVSYPSAPGVRPILNNSFTSRGGIGGTPASATGQKTFIPSYRLFEDLNVFGNTDGKVKMTSSGSSSSLSGTMGPGMVGGRK